MQLAERSGIRAEDVKPSVADTDCVGYTDVTGGAASRIATAGPRLRREDIQRQMIDRLPALWKVKPMS